MSAREWKRLMEGKREGKISLRCTGDGNWYEDQNTSGSRHLLFMNRIRCISLMCLARLQSPCETLSVSLRTQPRGYTHVGGMRSGAPRANESRSRERSSGRTYLSLAGRAYGKEKSSITFEAIQNWQRRDGPCFGPAVSLLWIPVIKLMRAFD